MHRACRPDHLRVRRLLHRRCPQGTHGTQTSSQPAAILSGPLHTSSSQQPSSLVLSKPFHLCIPNAGALQATARSRHRAKQMSCSGFCRLWECPWPLPFRSPTICCCAAADHFQAASGCRAGPSVDWAQVCPSSAGWWSAKPWETMARLQGEEAMPQEVGRVGLRHLLMLPVPYRPAQVLNPLPPGSPLLPSTPHHV